MAERRLDKLDLEMIQCEKDGYGVHYGRWKAAKDAGLLRRPVAKKPVNPPEITGQQKRHFCVRCGEMVPDNTRQRLYCSKECAKRAQAEQVLRAYHRKKSGKEGNTDELEI